MKRLGYFMLLLFVFSVFSPIFAQGHEDYNLWYKEHEWLMLKQEKNEWKSLKTDRQREEFITKFYTARDPDTFTYKNEFQLTYQVNLEKVRQNYPNFSDPRRYAHLLFGEPNSKRSFRDLSITINIPLTIRISVNEAEIWRYNFSGKNFQIIFAKLNIYQLQRIRDQQSEEFMPASLYSSEHEILYCGSEQYSTVETFLESFFQENFQLRNTSDTLNILKKQVLERAEKFYKQSKPAVRKKKYSDEWKKGAQILIEQFDINSPQEVGLAIWIFFDKNSLSYNAKKEQYSASVSLYCEIRDANNKSLIQYCDDDINYQVKKPKTYYHFWGSLPAGDYRLILEMGDNVGKRHVKIEQPIHILDYSGTGLKAGLLVGKIVEDSELVKGKDSYLFFKEGKFCPAFSGDYFRDDDEVVVVFDVSGFQKNLYGNPYLEIALLFIKDSEVFTYGFLPVEKDGNRFRGVIRFKVKDLIAGLRLSSGCYQIRLRIEDKIANQGGVKDYPYPILILSAETVQNNLNVLIKRTD